MKLRNAVQECRDLIRTFINAYSVTEAKPELAKTVEQLPSTAIQLPTPKIRDLKILSRKIQTLSTNGEWQKLSERDWRRVPWVLWLDRGNNCLAADTTFLSQLQKKLKNNPTLIRRLIRVYLRDFTADKPNIEQIAQMLRREISRVFVDESLKRWQASQQNYQIFIPKEGISKLAHACLQTDALLLLKQAGLTGSLATSGYVQAVYLQALESVTRNLAAGDDSLLEGFLAWSNEGGRLRYQTCRRELAEGLLLPWLHKMPEESVKQPIYLFLLHQYGDPRVNPGQWHGVKKNLLKIFYRWMVGATLETFFSILDLCALDKQWRYRRAFWWAYYERQYIDEAWLVLGKASQKFLARRPDLASSLQDAYGTLLGPGIKSNQSVLLFRIKRLIIAEWSHSGKCHIWFVDKTDAPHFYLEKYTKSAVTKNSERIKSEHKQAGVSHYGNETGSWQGDVADFIAKHARIRLSAEHYLPKF